MAWRARILTDNRDGLYAEVAKSHAKRNCLVIGPTGSGKLSLAMGLAALAHSSTRKFLFDWEVESQAQQGLLRETHLRSKTTREQRDIWIHRHLHRLPVTDLVDLLHTLISTSVDSCRCITHYATMSHRPVNLHADRLLDEVFDVRIAVTGGLPSSTPIEPMLALSLAMLKKQYGKKIPYVDSASRLFLREYAGTSGVSRMLNLLERAYLLAEDPRIQLPTLRQLAEGAGLSGTR